MKREQQTFPEGPVIAVKLLDTEQKAAAYNI